jgi:hypothetical protein
MHLLGQDGNIPKYETLEQSTYRLSIFMFPYKQFFSITILYLKVCRLQYLKSSLNWGECTVSDDGLKDRLGAFNFMDHLQIILVVTDYNLEV